MDSYQGDLADIVRASGGGGVANMYTEAQLPATNNPINQVNSSDFGDPFMIMDPIIPNSTIPLLYESNLEDEEIKGGSNSNLFSRILQISPAITPATTVAVTGSNNSLVESACGLHQISAPRNTAIKRRKNQAKKVVCIPAPAPAPVNSSRSSGEVVPSDLWAWRKYGQKPIKGSPYPRGYYRCSSSKGCSARKQVERSRNDPNMLVITYTSEHNHPWPTQRNALAGSTRSQPPKTNTKTSQIGQDKNTNNSNSAGVKEEDQEAQFDDINTHLLEFDELGGTGFNNSHGNNSSEDTNFFADLGEINEGDLLFLPEGELNKLVLDPFTFYH